ncbi:MAG: AAA family ATPase, partial [Armatimonadota bacterium]
MDYDGLEAPPLIWEPAMLDELPGDGHATGAWSTTSGNPFVGEILTLEEFFQLPVDQRWLVEGMCGRGEVGMLFGESNTGKSFVALNLLAALAAGVAFWGHDAFTIPEPATVIYCTAEGQHGLHKRLAALD